MGGECMVGPALNLQPSGYEPQRPGASLTTCEEAISEPLFKPDTSGTLAWDIDPRQP